VIGSALSPRVAGALLCLVQSVTAAWDLPVQAQPQLSTDQLGKRTLPATAAILTRNRAGGVVGVGSGFSIDSSGVVVTSWHLLQGAVKALVRFPPSEQFEWVRSFGGDSLADVAVLKVPGHDLPSLTTTTSIPHAGERVVVLGRGPGMSDTVSEGVVSGIRVRAGRQVVEISAPVSLTSNGGPVLDEQGRVFGILRSEIRDGEELNVAIPVRYALALLEEHPISRPLDSVFPAAGEPSDDQLDSDSPGDQQVVLALISAQKLVLDAQLPKEAVPFLDFAIAHGDAERRDKAATLLYVGATSLLMEPQDPEAAAGLLRKAVQAANPSGHLAPAAHYLLGLALLFQVPEPLEVHKSCVYARQKEALLQESEQAFHSAGGVNPEAVAKNLAIVRKYQPRIRSLVKAYCKQ
jgi:hypothetical protein